MRKKIIIFLKKNPFILRVCWLIAKIGFEICGVFIKTKEKSILFCSFGGRNYDDSPKALYEEICGREIFNDYNLVWAFVEPERFNIPRGEKIKIDTPKFFYTLLSSKVWISNSGMDRGIEIQKKGIVKVETWHGTPLKKIGGEENQNSLGGEKKRKRKIDKETIRCAQSEFDREIFARIFDADKECILLSDLPRNDKLFEYRSNDIARIRSNLKIPKDKKVILYTPTYREYLINGNNDIYIEPPIHMEKWEKKLGDEYILLVRAHYAVSASLGIKDSNFVRDVSNYPCLNDLYIISDMMISDYSSTFFDYSILDRPMFCFAYDLEEYEEKRGLYLKIEEVLPCGVDKTEDELLKHIVEGNVSDYSKKTAQFHRQFASYAGGASKKVVDKIEKKLGV